MLPNNVPTIRAIANRRTKEFLKEKEELLNVGYEDEQIDSMLMTVEDRKNALSEMGISNSSVFYEYYLNYVDEVDKDATEGLYSLDEIYEDYEQPFWKRYKEIEDRYLQLSSIEGEWSYFYDKQTDAVYGVDWGDMDDFIAGKLNPLFASFYDFLEWYYSDDVRN